MTFIVKNITEENFELAKEKAISLGYDFLQRYPTGIDGDASRITEKGICVRVERRDSGWVLMEDLYYYSQYKDQMSFEDFLSICSNPQHNPPNLKMNGLYRHTCPGCGKTTYL